MTVDPLPTIVQQALNQSALVQTEKSVALHPFHKALGARLTTPLDLIFIGDSISEGQGSSVLSNRWISQLLSTLRAKFQPTGVSGSTGYIPAWHAITSPSGTSPTTAGTPTQSNNSGLGRRCLQLNGNTDTVTFSFTGTSFDLYYTTQQSTVSQFSVKIDAGAPTTVTPSSGGVISAKWNSGALSAGSHTVLVSWVSNTPQIEGLMPYNGDETSGLRLFDAAHYGFTTSSFTSLGYWTSALSNITNPAIVFLYLGTNDFGTSVSSNQFQTNLTSILALIRAKLPNTTVAIIAGYERGGSFAEPWSNYIAAMNTVAYNDLLTYVIDLTTEMNKCDRETINGIYNVDNVHPTDIGHLMISDIVMKNLGL